jgi:hypothetical protein
VVGNIGEIIVLRDIGPSPVDPPDMVNGKVPGGPIEIGAVIRDGALRPPLG